MTKICALRIDGELWRNEKLEPEKDFPNILRIPVLDRIFLFWLYRVETHDGKQGNVGWYDLKRID